MEADGSANPFNCLPANNLRSNCPYDCCEAVPTSASFTQRRIFRCTANVFELGQTTPRRRDLPLTLPAFLLPFLTVERGQTLPERGPKT